MARTHTKNIITLLDINGEPIGTLSKKAEWELEEVTGSTNRLTITIPLKDASIVTTDQELIFRKKRYTIVEVSRYRGSGSVTIIADEAQVELSDKNIKKFTLKETSLPEAMAKAVEGSKWVVDYVYADARSYFAEIENRSSMYCLSFLESQSGGKLVFDSINRTVSMISLQDVKPVKTFRYRKNMDDISKIETQPKATVIYPYGKEGLSIAPLNNGVEYLEDFSWYEALGMSKAEARQKYSKEYVWEDSRYIFAGNLKRDAEKKLATMSHPQINYSISASGMEAEELNLNDTVYVVDEELGIKVKTVVSRLIICSDSSKNSIELDYIPESLGSALEQDSFGDTAGGMNDTAVFLVKNPSKVNVTAIPQILLTSSITVFTSTYFEVGFNIMLECTSEGVLEGYWMMEGNRIPTEFKQTLTKGWHSIGFTFLITQVQEGTKFLDLYLSSTGNVTIDAERAEMFVKSQGAYGGMSNARPDQRISEDVPALTIPDIYEAHNIRIIKDVAPKVNEHVPTLSIPHISEHVSYRLETTVPREQFAIVSRYEHVYLDVPTQEQVDNFIDTLHATRKIFKVITVGESWHLCTTTGNFLSIDYENKTITSDGNIHVTDGINDNVNRGKQVDFSQVEGELRLQEIYQR